MDDAADADPLPPAMMRAVAALNESDLSEEEHDRLLEAALAEVLELPSELDPAGDHPKPSGPATNAVQRMEADIAADRGKRRPRAE